MATPAEVAALYQQLLGREADVGGLNFYGSSGKTVDQIAADIRASQEYASRATAAPAPKSSSASSAPVSTGLLGVSYDGTGPSLSDINSLYRSVLGRDADPSGLQNYDRGNLSVDEIRRALVESPEYLQRVQSQVGGTIDRNAALNLISQGKDLSYESIINAGLGSTDGLKNSFQLAHIRSPAYQAMVSAFDPNYGTVAGRQFAQQAAKELGIDPEVLDQVAGKKFSELLANNQYSIYDPVSMNAVSQEVLNEIRRQTGADISESVLKPVYDYNTQVYGLTAVPHAKRSGTVKQIGSDLAGGFLGHVGNLLEPIGLEKYAAPITGAALTAALGPAGAGLASLGTAAAIGGAAAGALPSIAQGDYSGGLKNAAIGGATGYLGGSLAAGAGAPQTFGQAVRQGATQGAITGAAGGLLTGQNVLESGLTGGLLGGATSGLSYGIQSGYNALTGSGRPVVGGIDDSNFDLGKSMYLQDQYYGLQPRTPGSVGGIDDSNFDLGKSMYRQDQYYGRVPFEGGGGIDDSERDLGKSLALQDQYYATTPNFFNGNRGLGNGGISPIAPIANVLAGGLLGNALSGGFGQGSATGNATIGTGVFNPKVGFSLVPKTNKYTGDYATYGERGSGDFRFYEAPILGIMG